MIIRHMKYFTILIFLSVSIHTFCQNAFDENGLRTGPWIGYYPDSTIRYEANFENGNPVGRMKRYDSNGVLNAIMHFYDGSDRCLVKIYSSGGSIKAEGVYDSQLKDSTWIYFAADGRIRMIENFNMGALNDTSKSFYPSGHIAGKVYYSENKKEGALVQFFENGDTMVIANYKDDFLDGDFFSFDPSTQIQISGKYYKDLKDGNWCYYSEEGDTLAFLKYDKGEILNPAVLDESYEQFIKKIEKDLENPVNYDNSGDF